MKLIFILITLSLMTLELSGCLAAAVGAGAAGGAYVQKNYNISVKAHKKTEAEQNS